MMEYTNEVKFYIGTLILCAIVKVIAVVLLSI